MIKKIFLTRFVETFAKSRLKICTEEIKLEDLTTEYACKFLRNLKDFKENIKYHYGSRLGAILTRQYFANEDDVCNRRVLLEDKLTSYCGKLASKTEINKFVKYLKNEPELRSQFFYSKEFNVNLNTVLKERTDFQTMKYIIGKSANDINKFLILNKYFYVELGVDFYSGERKVKTFTSTLFSEEITGKIMENSITNFVKEYGGKIKE